MSFILESRALRERVLESIDLGVEQNDGQILQLIDRILEEESGFGLLPVRQREQVRRDLFYSLRRLDILQPLLEDPEITEIMVNGPEHIFVERKGRLEKSELRFESREKLMDVIQQIVAACNRTVNEASPVVDARISGSTDARVNVVLSSIALNGPILTIRRFPDHPITIEQLIAFEAVSPEAVTFLKKMVQAKYNILISGGTGSGKTTFLNVLSGFIPAQERVITIEDSAELRLQGIENLVRMETRSGTVEGCLPVTIRDLIKTSLRMRPDRIIVGEVRGGEAYDMVQCLNTGHDGSMSTAHANSARDMLQRLENMILMGMELPLDAIRRQIASGIDLLVHLGRLRDGSRKVLEIQEVCGYAAGEIVLRPLYLYEEKGERDGHVIGELKKKGEPEHVYKLQAAGLSFG